MKKRCIGCPKRFTPTIFEREFCSAACRDRFKTVVAKVRSGLVALGFYA